MKVKKIMIVVIVGFLGFSVFSGIATVKGSAPTGEKCIGHDCLIFLPVEEYGYPCDERIEGEMNCCHGFSFETLGHAKG